MRSDGPDRALPAEPGRPVDLEDWDEKMLVWNHRPFLRAKVKTVFYVPIDLGRKLRRAQAQLEGAGAAVPGGLVLMQHRSPWVADLYVDVSRPVPGATIATIDGTFMTRVLDGHYRDAPRLAAEMQRHVEDRGRRLRKLYYAWNAGPSPARPVGRQRCVVFAEV